LNLLKTAQNTNFGKLHHFKDITSIQDFQQAVPIRNYEEFLPFLTPTINGEPNQTWVNKPLYLAKTSGTTAGSKYIPITKESIFYQITGARDALLCYLHKKPEANFLSGKLLFLSGSPQLEKNQAGIPTGRLSGIVNHFVPNYLRTNQVPTFKTNCIEDWELKVETIVQETISQDLRLISGIPPWVQMFLEKVYQRTGKKPVELWKNLQLFVHGGVDFSPYQEPLLNCFGKKIDVVEVYPASEGFFAIQDNYQEDGLLLMPAYGIFYEFIPIETYFSENPKRLSLDEVTLNQQYALLISTNAGLWAYDIGDTIRFVSLNPYKIKVTGRIKQFISAFGEHVIEEEINETMQLACKQTGTKVREYSVAPLVQGNESRHQWFIEFEYCENLQEFGNLLDIILQQKNC
ncbi:MAG: GH3 auxin-responsive promoter family protein, partial [Bacteroidia bacterium]|nr:GH3 auxin-responsive promoter family protein [Bacteroidia bacterium]